MKVVVVAKVEIKPCPFCGGTSEVMSKWWGDSYAGRCSTCWAVGPWYGSIDGAVNAWNRRTIHVREVVE